MNEQLVLPRQCNRTQSLFYFKKGDLAIKHFLHVLVDGWIEMQMITVSNSHELVHFQYSCVNSRCHNVIKEQEAFFVCRLEHDLIC